MLRVAAKATATGTENDQFFVAHHGDREAIGFLAVGEITLQSADRDPAHGLLISGLAVDHRIAGANVLRSLLRRAVIVRNAKLRAKEYGFEAALVTDKERIEQLLERAGFVRWEDAIWLRPIP